MTFFNEEIPLEAPPEPFVRPEDPAHASVVRGARAADPNVPDAPVIDVLNTDIAFRARSTAELHRARLLFNTLKYQALVKTGPWFVNTALRLGLPVKASLKRYLFAQFCAGESLQDSLPTIVNLHAHGTLSILDYSVEAEKTDEAFDATQNELLRGLRFAKEHPAVAFVAMKLTGIGPAEVYAKKQEGSPLTARENAQFNRAVKRLEEICALAAELGQPLYIDAEESWTQDVFDGLCEAMMAEHNTQRPIVYTTVQMYRHDRLHYLKALAKRMDLRNAQLGVKLVRGAYMEKEHARAKDKGYPTPIQPTKEACDRDFDAAAEFLLQRLDTTGLCLGTHNEPSTVKAAEWVVKNNVDRAHPNLSFAQLYGMRDNLTFNLAEAGFSAAKYLPYGPLKSVLPYLFRRAQENSSASAQSSRELELVEMELVRRKRQQAFRKRRTRYRNPAEA